MCLLNGRYLNPASGNLDDQDEFVAALDSKLAIVLMGDLPIISRRSSVGPVGDEQEVNSILRPDHRHYAALMDFAHPVVANGSRRSAR